MNTTPTTTPEMMFQRYKNGAPAKAAQKLNEIMDEFKKCGFILNTEIEPMGEFIDFLEQRNMRIVMKRYANHRDISIVKKVKSSSICIPIQFC